LAELATGNDLETYLQRQSCILPGVDTGVQPTDALGGAQHDKPASRDVQGHMTQIRHSSRRIAYCECGAQLAGNSEQELFKAAQRHVAHHHPQLLGALELDVVQQMAEDVGG
jgi:hypothetical protein